MQAEPEPTEKTQTMSADELYEAHFPAIEVSDEVIERFYNLPAVEEDEN